MREAFVNTLFEEAKKNPKIYLLTADLGFTVFEKFQTEFPSRFLNVGVAEANMMGVASGLAAAGCLPVVYSIANFAVLRPFEQIRNDICFSNRNIKIVGVGAGLAYGHAGFTHHSTEDVALARSMPNLTILCPSGPSETRDATKVMLTHSGPVYLRLSKKGEPDLTRNESRFQIGKARILREGDDVTFFGYGAILENVLRSAELLSRNHQIEASVLNLHTLQPLDEEAIVRFAKRTRFLISVEEHGITGGLGSAIAEVLAERPELNASLLRCGIIEKFSAVTGDRDYLLQKSRLSPSQLEERALQFLPAPKR